MSGRSRPSVRSAKNHSPTREDDQPDDRATRSGRRRRGRRGGAEQVGGGATGGGGRRRAGRRWAPAAASPSTVGRGVGGSACAWCRSDRVVHGRALERSVGAVRAVRRHRSPGRLESDRPRRGRRRSPARRADDGDGGMAWRIRRRSACSAARASTRCSTTCARSRSTRRTARRRIRSSSPRSAGRRVAFLPRHGRRHTHPAAQDQLPGQRLGDALARGQGRHLAVRRRLAPARGQARRLRRVRPVRRPDRAAGPTRSTTARSSPTSHRPRSTTRSCAGSPSTRSATTASRSTSGARSSSSRARASRPKAESKWFSDAGWEVINMTQYPEAWLCRELGMAVVNISLITDYDAGVHEGTEAVNAMSVLEVFQQNAERIQARRARPDRAVPGRTSTRSGRAPPSSRPAATATRSRTRTSGCSRPGCERWPGRGPTGRLPIGVCLRTIRAEPGWWLESARRLDAAGYAGRVGLGPLHGPGRPDGARSSRAGRSWRWPPRDRRGSRSGRSCSTS